MDYLNTDLPDNREQTGKLLDDILHHFIGSVHKAGQLLYKTKKGFHGNDALYQYIMAGKQACNWWQ